MLPVTLYRGLQAGEGDTESYFRFEVAKGVPVYYFTDTYSL